MNTRFLFLLLALAAGIAAFAADHGEILPGTTRTGEITGPSFRDTWTLNCTAGERLLLSAVQTSGTLNTQIYLYPPGGGSAEVAGDDLLDRQLQATGTYTIVIQDWGLDHTGTYNITAIKIPDEGVAILSGDTLTGAIEAPSARNTFKIFGTTGERLLVSAVQTSGTLNTQIYLYPPGGGSVEVTGDDVLDRQLQATGTYTIVIQDWGLDHVGTYNITAIKIPGAISTPSDPDGGMLSSDNSLQGTINARSDRDVFHVYGMAGERLLVSAVRTSGTLNTQIYLYPPGSGSLETSGDDTIDWQLRQTGLYSIIIQDWGLDHTGTYNVSVTKLPSTISPGLYNPSPPNGAILDSAAGVFCWDAVAGATGYDLYFCDDPLSSLTRIATNITLPTSAFPTLRQGRRNFWQVIAHLPSGDVIGPVWWFMVGPAKPDLLIRNHGDTEYVGENIFNVLDEQTKTQTAKIAASVIYEVKLKNTGDTAGKYRLHGSAGGWTVRYFDALADGNEVTGSMTGDGWVVEVPAQGALELRVEVGPPAGAVAQGAQQVVDITAEAVLDSSKIDAVQAVAVKPDLRLTAALPSPQEAGTPVTLQAQILPERVEDFQYRFRTGSYISGRWTWVTLRDWGISATCAWTPQAAANYLVEVGARVPGHAAPDLIVTMTYTVMPRPLTWIRFTAPLPSPFLVNEPVRLTANAGDGPVEYRFRAYYRDDTGWHFITIRDYGTAGSCMWTPTVMRRYVLQTYARAVGRTADYDVTANVNPFDVVALTGVTLAAAPPSPRPLGATITLTAQANSTGVGGAVYLFRAGRVENGTPVWATVRDWNASPTCAWTPAVDGAYLLEVWARGASAADDARVISPQVGYTITPPLTGVSLTGDPPSPQLINISVTLTAHPVGGANLEYLFREGYKVGDAWYWQTLQWWSPAATCPWRPAVARNYTLTVAAREVGSTLQKEGALYYRIVNPLSAVQFTAAPPSPAAAGSPVALTAAATGGLNVEYQFRVGIKANGSWSWTVIRAYARSPLCTWTPASPGQYTLAVLAREAGVANFTPVYDVQQYLVSTPLTQVTLTAIPASPQPPGTEITLLAEADGGSNVEYRFRVGYKEGDAWHWEVLRNYSASPVCLWFPSEARLYTLQVYAREKGVTNVNPVNGWISYQVQTQ